MRRLKALLIALPLALSMEWAASAEIHSNAGSLAVGDPAVVVGPVPGARIQTMAVCGGPYNREIAIGTHVKIIHLSRDRAAVTYRTPSGATGCTDAGMIRDLAGHNSAFPPVGMTGRISAMPAFPLHVESTCDTTDPDFTMVDLHNGDRVTVATSPVRGFLLVRTNDGRVACIGIANLGL